jgi:virginiamycin B lyase
MKNLAAAFLWLGLAGMAAAQPAAVMLYNFPVANPDCAIVSPVGITGGSDGAIWFAEGGYYFSNCPGGIGRMTLSGDYSYYALPNNSDAWSIASGPDGALWFTQQDSQNTIGRIATSGAIALYPLPWSDIVPFNITAGPDGALWFTAINADNDAIIGRITTSGEFSMYSVPGGSLANAITVGPDGALWFTESSGIGRITTSGSITQYAVPGSSGFYNLRGITRGSDGALWFTEDSPAQIGRMTTAGAFTFYPTSSSWAPGGIASAPNGTMWVIGGQAYPGEFVAQITTDGNITQYAIPGFSTSGENPTNITVLPNGQAWFTLGEYTWNHVGQALTPQASLTVSPATGHYKSILTFSGIGYAANELVNIFKDGIGSRVLASGTTDATGSFTASAQAPQWSCGARVFYGVGQTSHKVGAANFSYTAFLTLSPTSGPPGTTVTVDGYGFYSYYGPVIYVNGRYRLGSASVNGDGTIDPPFTFSVPHFAPGSYGLVGDGANCVGPSTTPFTVE